MSTVEGLHIRWMIRRDMAEVLDIERRSFEYPWSEDDFVRCLRQRNCIGMVAEQTGTELILGFMVYELHKQWLHILDFAVHPEWRMLGVGAAMVSKIKSKLDPRRMARVLLEVRETNVDAQLFFKRQGFRAVSALRDFYEDTTEDAYVMQFKVPQESQVTT